MDTILLSIIIPCYKVERYIEQCLDSIFNHNIDSILYEVIVVNDGTPDRSAELVKPYTHEHSNCTLINQENEGLSAARNTGLDAAKGEYVWFIDSDDWLCDNALSVVFDILEKNKDVDVITSPLLWSYTDSAKNYLDISLRSDIKVSGKQYIRSNFPTGAIQRNVIKKSILEKANIRFYPGILHEDGLFGPQMFYQAQNVYVLSHSIYNYRQRDDGSIMHNITIKSAYDLITVHQQLIKYMNEYVADEDKIWFRYFCLTLFDTALKFTWNLRGSNEFKTFLSKTKKYRQDECKEMMVHGSIKQRLKAFMFCYFPISIRKIKYRLRRE